MTELYEKSLQKLELDRVLELLAGCAVSGEAKDRCRSLLPNSDKEDVTALQLQTSDACRLIDLRSSPAFQDVHDVRASLDRADRGGSLNPKELLQIAAVLRCARSAKEYYDGACANTSLDWMFAALTPNRYLEERITGAILSEEEIADAAMSLRTSGGICGSRAPRSRKAFRSSSPRPPIPNSCGTPSSPCGRTAMWCLSRRSSKMRSPA